MIAKLKESIMKNFSAFLTSRCFSVNLHVEGDKVERQVERESSMDTDATVTRGSLCQFLNLYMAEKNRKSKRSPSRPKNNKVQRGHSLTRKPLSRSNSDKEEKFQQLRIVLAACLSFLERTQKTSSQKLQTKKTPKPTKGKSRRKTRKLVNWEFPTTENKLLSLLKLATFRFVMWNGLWIMIV